MAREALLQMNCSRFSEKIIDIIDLLYSFIIETMKKSL